MICFDIKWNEIKLIIYIAKKNDLLSNLCLQIFDLINQICQLLFLIIEDVSFNQVSNLYLFIYLHIYLYNIF
jgi:hypothetical protein